MLAEDTPDTFAKVQMNGNPGMTQSSEPDWFIARGANPVGPMNFDQLRAHALNGKLTPSDRIWKQGTAAWVAAGSIEGLFTRAQVQSAPPPLPTSPLQYASPIPPQTGRSIGDDAGIRMLIPVGRSGWAIAAGYLGLISVIVLPAPFAIVFGCIAIRDIKKNPNKHGLGRAYFGLIMGIIFTFAPLGFLGWALVTGK